MRKDVYRIVCPCTVVCVFVFPTSPEAPVRNAEKYDELAQSLAHREFMTLTEALRKRGQLDVRYWICAFSVNQHTGICASPPPSDSTGYAITPCGCSTAKHFSGELSEMNKFDDMMAYLKDSKFLLTSTNAKRRLHISCDPYAIFA